VEFKSDPIYLSIHPFNRSEGHRYHHRANAKSKYLPQKSVTGKQKKTSSTPRSQSMFQNHGKTKTGQKQRERDKSTVISLKKKANIGSDIGKPPKQRDARGHVRKP